MHIRAYLFMMAAGILIPVILFAGVALRMLQNAEKNAALAALVETANGIALRVDRELYSAEATLSVLAASPSLGEGNLRAFYDQAVVGSRHGTAWHVLIDGDGQQLINTSVPFGTNLPRSRVSPFSGATAGKTSVSNLLVGPLSNKLITTVNLPLMLPDGRRLVLSHRFSTAHFDTLIANAKVPAGWLVGLIDGNGNFIARNLNADKLTGTPARPELVAAMRRSRSGQIRHRTIEGTEAYDVFTHPSISAWGVAVAAPVEQIDRSARQASFVAAMGLLAATACALALAILFGRFHVRSIGRAVAAATDLGDGIPPLRLTSRVLEVNELHGALHAAGEQLRHAQAYRKHTEAERQALLEGEQKARQMAEQQSLAKDQFLAMLGHELRNPLAPISTAAQLLKLQPNDAARVRYASDVIVRQVDHMNSLLGDMLDVSRVTRGLVALNLEPVDLKAVIERALEQTGGLIELKQHQLALDLPPAPLQVRGDKTRLIQIFANLLGNAAKYTPTGGRIAVTARADAAAVTVTVGDNGEGFPAELLPRIFDLFSQGERSPDRAQGGLGLGLALVRSLVQLHGGTVAATSAGPGQGSTFTVMLPREAQEPAQAPGAHEHAAPGNALRVMVVDDNADGANSLSLLLGEAGGHQVSTCYDGAAALAMAPAAAPQVFILDIGLPDMTGYDLARQLRAMPQFGCAIFIALTGYGQSQDKARAVDAGFDHHVAKPADPAFILDLLNGIAPQG